MWLPAGGGALILDRHRSTPPSAGQASDGSRLITFVQIRPAAEHAGQGKRQHRRVSVPEILAQNFLCGRINAL